jgi:DNA-binding response OmpR family regulator
MPSILVVEDDPGIRTALSRGLADRGHAVSSVPGGMRALEACLREDPDVVLLDLGLPDIPGLQVLAMLRGVSAVPVIVITAQDEDSTLVAALDGGADDYVVKPFGLEQIAARIRAVLRRAAQAADADGGAGGGIRVGDLAVDPRSRTVTLAGEPVDLTRREFDLLLALASRPGEVVTKRELLSEVWQQPWGGGDRTVDVHLSWLRRKLGETASNPRYLHTVRGVGVRLEAPAAEGQPG